MHFTSLSCLMSYNRRRCLSRHCLSRYWSCSYMMVKYRQCPFFGSLGQTQFVQLLYPVYPFLCMLYTYPNDHATLCKQKMTKNQTITELKWKNVHGNYPFHFFTYTLCWFVNDKTDPNIPM